MKFPVIFASMFAAILASHVLAVPAPTIPNMKQIEERVSYSLGSFKRF